MGGEKKAPSREDYFKRNETKSTNATCYLLGWALIQNINSCSV